MKHILCAIDLTHVETEKKVLHTAVELSNLYDATLSVVTVIPDYGMSIVGSYFKDGTMELALEDANRQLRDFVKQTLPNFNDVQYIVEVGTIYEKILDVVKRSNTDLVVIGAQKPNLMDHLQGPNSARVSRQASCSVLVVRPT